MSRNEQIDVSTPAFARRFAAMLVDHRVRTRQYLWRLARHSDGRFSVEALQDIEAGITRLDHDDVDVLVQIYGLSWDELLPPRVPLEVSPLGTIVANGVEVPFDPRDDRSLLTSYLALIRTVRDQLDRTMIEIRREDVEVLADHLQLGGSWVITELAILMGANERERRAMAAMFIAGAHVISVSTPRPATAEQPTEVVHLGVKTRAPASNPTEPSERHPSRYHVVIPDREGQPGTVTVLADWQRGR